jgi:hypothetical protein
MHDLHPGSIRAALQYRKAELESKDPRCSVSISIQDGHERLTIHAKEPFSVSAKIRTQNINGWRDFFERGAKVKVQAGEIEIEGSPLIKELFERTTGNMELQFRAEIPASIHFVGNTTEGLKIIPIDGHFQRGMKYVTFHESHPDWPFGFSFEVSRDELFNADTLCGGIRFSPSKWAGQPILQLAYFDQTKAFAELFSGDIKPTMEIFVRGNSFCKGHTEGGTPTMLQQMASWIQWVCKCRWLAEHFQVNPVMPPLDKLSTEQIECIEELYGLMTKSESWFRKCRVNS